MRFDVITIFPELFQQFLQLGVTRRAFQTNKVVVKLWQLRDFSRAKHQKVDERPFGGGPGMVMLPQVLLDCLQSVQANRPETAPVILFSPSGKTLKQTRVEALASQSQGAILICGRYEGIDQRFIDLYVDEQISLGDFILSGGEIPAMVLLDSIARLQEGVLNKAASYQQESFSQHSSGLLDYPHYTRPEVWQNQAVPKVLLSGNHQQIASWRQQQQLAFTQQLRPDLLDD